MRPAMSRVDHDGPPATPRTKGSLGLGAAGAALQRCAHQRDRSPQVTHDQRRRNPQHAVAQHVELAVAAGVRRDAGFAGDGFWLSTEDP